MPTIQIRSNLSIEEVFWNFIQKIDWKQKEDSHKVAPLVNALAATDSSTIYQFSECLAYLLHQLDGPAFAQALEKDELGFSADTFLYVRCLVVAKGQTYYQEVLNEPTKMPTGEDFEALLSVAEQAYLKKTGKDYTYIPIINYESFFNQELWRENVIIL